MNACSEQTSFKKSDGKINSDSVEKNSKEQKANNSKKDKESTNSNKDQKTDSEVSTPIVVDNEKEETQIIDTVNKQENDLAYLVASECGMPEYLVLYNDLSPSILDESFMFPLQTYNPKDKDSDLSINIDAEDFKSDESILIRGMLRTQEGTPLTGAVIDILQDSPDGDSWLEANSDSPDAAQLWGRSLTDDKGCFEFKTFKFASNTSGKELAFQITPWNQEPKKIQLKFSVENGTKEIVVNNLNDKTRVIFFNPIL